MIPYIHPAIGGLTAILLLVAGNLGLRSRQRRPNAAKLRRWHTYSARAAFILISLTTLGGTITTALARDDLALAGSPHFWLGWLVFGLMLAAAALSRWLPADPRAKRLHPILGGAAMAACTVQALLGFNLLPY